MDKKKHVATLRQWIEQRLETPITVDDICKTSGYSEAYLQKIFRKETSLTINEYLTFRRLYKCALAIKFTYTPIAKIAQRYCFSSMPVFSRLFRRVFGMAPRQFRDEETIDFGALSDAQSIFDTNCQPLDVEYVYFDGLPLFGLSYEYSVDPHDFDKSHIARKAPIESEFVYQTLGKFREVYCQIQYQRDERYRDRIAMRCNIGLQEIEAQHFPALTPLPALVGDYLMFTCRTITTPFFDVCAKIYWEIMFKRKITRRKGVEIERIIWRDISLPGQQIKTVIDYSYMIPVILDEKAHVLVRHHKTIM